MSTAKATMPVHEIMSRMPVTIQASTSIGELIELFDRHDYNAFPVTDASNVLIGIVTKLDLLRLLRPGIDLELRDPLGVSLRPAVEIMRPGVVTIEGEDPVGVAADLMVETGLRSLPVVHRGSGRPELVGMLSRGDVIRGLRFAMRDHG